MKNERLPREAAELMALAESGSLDEALLPLDPERLADARAGGRLAWGVTGHGVMSWAFRIVVRTAKLDLELTRPALRSLADEDTRAQIASDIRSVCRLAALACCRAMDERFGRLMLRSESADSWTWCLEQKGVFRVGDTFDELVNLLAVGGDEVDPLTVTYV